MSGEGALRVTSDAGQDLVCGFGPDEVGWILVMYVDVLADGGFQVFHTSKHAPSNALIGEFGEPSLHQIDPGTVGGGEVDMKSGSFSEPFPDDGCFMRAVVVHDDMDIESDGHLILDQI